MFAETAVIVAFGLVFFAVGFAVARAGARPTGTVLHANAGAVRGTAPLMLAPNDGRPLSVVGDTIVVKLAPRPGGPGAVIEEITPPGGGPPPHQHDEDEELMYITEGRFEVRIGNRTQIAEKGAFAFLPRGVPHSFRNIDGKPSRAIVFVTPGQVVSFFERVDALVPGDATPDALSRMAADHGLHFLPPKG
jgi:quercetin dioxygenase-like cupin family protein